MEIKEIDSVVFDEFSHNHPYTEFQQTSAWGKLKSLVGWFPFYLGAYDINKELVAAGLFLARKMPLINAYLYYSPRGYLIDYEDIELLNNFNNALIEYLKKKKCFKLIIDPYYPYIERDIDGEKVLNGFNHQNTVDALTSFGYRHVSMLPGYKNLQPRFLFRLPLDNKTYQEIVDNFRYETKRRIRKKDFLAISIRELERQELISYKRLMEATAERRGFIDRPLSYYEEMYDCLKPQDIVHFFAAEIDFSQCLFNINKMIADSENKIMQMRKKNPLSTKTQNRIKEEEIILNKNKELIKIIQNVQKERGNNAILSVVCLLTYGQEAIMLLAGNDEKYLQDFNTSNIIVAELIRYAKEKGYRYYNFYGIGDDFSKNNELYGLYLYKRQYGGEVVELIGQFEYIINPVINKIYELALKTYKLLRKKH